MTLNKYQTSRLISELSLILYYHQYIQIIIPETTDVIKVKANGYDRIDILKRFRLNDENPGVIHYVKSDVLGQRRYRVKTNKVIK